MSTPTDDQSPIEAFLSRYWKDREAGAVRELHEYLSDLDDLLRRHPGADTQIAQEYVSLAAETQAEPIKPDTQRVGPYEILEEIGQGGQAIVFRALDTRNQKEVALKVLRHMGSEQAVERFRREAAIAAKIEDQSGLVARDTWRSPLRGARLTKSPASSSLGHAQLLLDVSDGLPSASRAQKFPLATSLRIERPRAWSATIFFRRPFSFSSSRSRLAWSSLRPPYSFRQR